MDERLTREDLDFRWHELDKALLNRLARVFYAAQGYCVPDDFDFTQSRHPQEQNCFAMAAAAINTLRGEGWEQPDDVD